MHEVMLGGILGAFRWAVTHEHVINIMKETLVKLFDLLSQLLLLRKVYFLKKIGVHITKYLLRRFASIIFSIK